MAADPLHNAFERFLDDRDEAALLAAVRRYGGRAPSKDVDHPVAHRICDVQLDGSGFQVARVFDPDDKATKLYIYPTDSPSVTQPGVPFRLQGAALQQWVEDESRSPTKGPVQWSRYEASLPDGV
jgi:hypothetical protein